MFSCSRASYWGLMSENAEPLGAIRRVTMLAGVAERWKREELMLCVENLFEMCSTAKHNQGYYMEDYVISNGLSLVL